MSELTDKRWKEFDEIGERKVRQNLANRIYGEENNLLARAWLEHRDKTQRLEADARVAASSLEQIRIARSAKNAAWAAAVAAIIAAICAAIAIAIVVSFLKP